MVGYRSPSWEVTDHTRGLLVAHGFTYSSNYLDDIYPYPNADGIVEIPVSWILDDAPHFWFSHDNWGKTIRSIREVADVWIPEMEGIAERGAHIMLTMHPMLIGRPSRLTLLERVLVWLREKDAWIGSSRSVADLVRDIR
ncbi:MAG: hypothetical protein KJ659_05360 [Actinobacteria bacterium]|nr:hypothetical protein [Actinomycetota bacterium]MBU2384915.1 hypothetical protein [Actinomycetota bacterium]